MKAKITSKKYKINVINAYETTEQNETTAQNNLETWELITISIIIVLIFIFVLMLLVSF